MPRPAASSGAMVGTHPSRLARLMMSSSSGRDAAMITAMQKVPVGAAESVSPPMMKPTAAGNSRPVARARSIDTHVASTPKAMIGSGRRPLL